MCSQEPCNSNNSKGLRVMVASCRLGKEIPWRIRGSVVRYWHPDIEKRDLQTGYLGSPGLLEAP